MTFFKISVFGRLVSYSFLYVLSNKVNEEPASLDANVVGFFSPGFFLWSKTFWTVSFDSRKNSHTRYWSVLLIPSTRIVGLVGCLLHPIAPEITSKESKYHRGLHNKDYVNDNLLNNWTNLHCFGLPDCCTFTNINRAARDERIANNTDAAILIEGTNWLHKGLRLVPNSQLLSNL